MISHIIIFISYFILQIFLLKTFQNFLKKKLYISKFSIIFMFFFNALINTYLFFENLVAMCSLYNFLFFFVFIKYAFKINLKQTIFYGFVVWTFALVLDILIMNIMKLFPHYIFYSVGSKLISTCFLIAFLLILSKIELLNKYVKTIYEKINKTNFSKLKLVLMIISYIILDIVCLYNIEIQNFGVLIFIMAFSLFVFLFLFISKQYAIYILKTSNQFLLKNGKESIKVITDYRILKHNITNQLIGIKTVSNKKTKILIDELIQTYNDKFHSTSYLLEIPSGINGLIFEKIHSLKDHNINIEIDNKITDDTLLEKIGAKNYNQLCEAIGVSLDNAIEAVVDSSEKILYLHFSEDESFITIIIINSFSGTIDIDNLGTANYSSKGSNHGIGLFSLLQRKNIKVKYQIKNNYFKTIIKLEKQLQEY